jgi:hypothetical protein
VRSLCQQDTPDNRPETFRGEQSDGARACFSNHPAIWKASYSSHEVGGVSDQ